MANPQSKAINQKRGPTTGNAGNNSKRNAFMDAKATSGSERSALADMVTSALETRGRDMRSYRDPAVEPLKEKVGAARNPIADGSKLPSKYKKPITKG